MNIVELDQNEISAVSAAHCVSELFIGHIGGILATYGALLLYKKARSMDIIGGPVSQGGWLSTLQAAGKLYGYIAAGCFLTSAVYDTLIAAFTKKDR